MTLYTSKIISIFMSKKMEGNPKLENEKKKQHLSV